MKGLIFAIFAIFAVFVLTESKSMTETEIKALADSLEAATDEKAKINRALLQLASENLQNSKTCNELITKQNVESVCKSVGEKVVNSKLQIDNINILLLRLIAELQKQQQPQSISIPFPLGSYVLSPPSSEYQQPPTQERPQVNQPVNWGYATPIGK